jgi:hypothetical protein
LGNTERGCRISAVGSRQAVKNLDDTTDLDSCTVNAAATYSYLYPPDLCVAGLTKFLSLSLCLACWRCALKRYQTAEKEPILRTDVLKSVWAMVDWGVK